MSAFLAATLALLVSATPGAAARPVPTRGDLRLLVVLAAFPDRPLARERTYFAGNPRALVDRLVAYYAEVSAGRLRIVPHVGTPIVTLPEARARYVQRPSVLAHDAATAFVAAAAAADRAALAEAHALLVFFAGPGRESHIEGGDPGDPWSNYTEFAPPVLGQNEACVIAEEEVPPFSNFGVLCHEFGHLLGLPELYAPGGLPQEGIGVWGLMGQGTWLGRGDHPPHLEAWSKVRLGWADVTTVEGSSRTIELPAVEIEPRVLKIPAVPARPQEYYLLENRSRIGADEKLPGEGVLVWHVDERVSGFRSAQTEAAHKLLHLVEADGRDDLDRGHAAGGNRGDATDPWYGPPRWRRRAGAGLALAGAFLVAAAVFRARRPGSLVPVLIRSAAAAGALAAAAALRRAPVCGPGTPGMAPYEGEPVRVVIRNLSPPGPRMSCDVLVATAPATE
jgi:immune inhibitor A